MVGHLRTEDQDDRRATSDTLKENVIPFDVRSDRYLSFRTTENALRAILPVLKQRLWDALENSQWFRISKGKVFSVGPLEGADGRSAFVIDVRPTDFTERQLGPKAGKVHVEITVRGTGDRKKVRRNAVSFEPIKRSLGLGETMALATLPWRLKFHWFEGDKARFCVEPTGRRA